MSLFAKLVMASAARSNHHRIALMALDLLEGRQAPRWRDLFLQHYEAYFEGAKAPDDVFKDFKNHVLHVQDGFWGGAPEAAGEWYKRTVRALKAQDWRLAAYNAGVMSHYVADPIQPFHTAQSEAEMVIHRAVEQSFSKAYPALKLILDVDLGGPPKIALPEGPDWLRDAMRAGAVEANRHYQTILDHYNHAAGVKNPPAGLDQELKDIAARQLGYASALLARVLDRAIAEAGASAPTVNLTLDAIFAVMKAPIRAVAGAIEDLEERKFVEAMHAEFVKTGKVRATLPEDDKVVRALHAAEVLNEPLSSLECRWPQETGTVHGEGAPARVTVKPKKARTEKAPKPAATAPIVAATPPAAAEPAPMPAPEPAAKPAPEPAAESAPAARLSIDADVVDAPSIGPKTAERLKAIGVLRVADLLAATPEEAAKQIASSYITAQVIRDWQAQAGLALSVPGLSGTAAQILVGAGVRDAQTLADANGAQLIAQCLKFCKSADGQRLLRNSAPPAPALILGWIEAAKGAGARQAA